MNRPWLYFGCHQEAGHYLWYGNGLRAKYDHPLGKFDGSLCLPKAVGERVAALSRLGASGYSALAFWDCSVDSRSGSNSIIFAPSLDITAAEMVKGAKLHLPLFAKRWPSIDVSRAEYRPDVAAAKAATGGQTIGFDAGKVAHHAHGLELAAQRLRADGRLGLAASCDGAAAFLRTSFDEAQPAARPT